MVALHGYIFFATGHLDPCAAASTRLAREYHLSNAGFEPEFLTLLPGPDGRTHYPKHVQDIMAKSTALAPYGWLGCYLPAIAG